MSHDPPPLNGEKSTVELQVESFGKYKYKASKSYNFIYSKKKEGILDIFKIKKERRTNECWTFANNHKGTTCSHAHDSMQVCTVNSAPIQILSKIIIRFKKRAFDCVQTGR